MIQDPNVGQAIQRLVASGQPYLGSFMTRNEENEADTVNSINEIYRIGTLCRVLRADISSDKSMTASLMPYRRIRITDFLPPNSGGILESEVTEDDSTKHFKAYDVMENALVSRAFVSNMHDEPHSNDNPVAKAISTEILALVKDMIRFNPNIRDLFNTLGYMSASNIIDNPSALADFAASLSTFGEPHELQAVLESLVIEERLSKAYVILKKEVENLRVQSQINSDVEEKMAKARKDYYIMEQIKGIKKELGFDSDGREKLVKKFEKRIGDLNIPKDAKSVFEDELAKFKTLSPSSMEYNVTRNYLDWITKIPWGKFTKDNFDISFARKVLDEDHYGMRDVKNRILEFIAVGKLRESVQGKIICLSGPPGVGKTSIGKSIARALNRKFSRFSVGGLNDVSEIKGHRRTYVGAMPGKLVQTLKRVQSENPLILIDEIDKIGRHSYRGDPSSALLEVLDPEQNKSFLDHYLDIPIDLSKTLFVCTANVLDTIPGPLLDRMEVIELSGYVEDEKIAIAEKYLMPSASQTSGISGDQVHVSNDALHSLIKHYCRESGVRSLKNHIEKIYRHAALQLVEDTEKGSTKKIEVTSDNLKSFVGSPIFSKEVLYDKPIVGVVMGLAYTGMGGTPLYIETLLLDKIAKTKNKRPNFYQTGQMGDVMKESTSIALTYAKNYMSQHHPDSDFFSKASIHLHVPQGAVKKDGPSAGISMTSSLLSLALNRPISKDIAMTGEITLTGKVLRIGGVKEKLIAAKRSGVKQVIMPKDNQADYEELDKNIREGIEVHFVDHYSEVADLIF